MHALLIGGDPRYHAHDRPLGRRRRRLLPEPRDEAPDLGAFEGLDGSAVSLAPIQLAEPAPKRRFGGLLVGAVERRVDLHPPLVHRLRAVLRDQVLPQHLGEIGRLLKRGVGERVHHDAGAFGLFGLLCGDEI